MLALIAVRVAPERRRPKVHADSDGAIVLAAAIVRLLVIAIFGVASLFQA